MRHPTNHWSTGIRGPQRSDQVDEAESDCKPLLDAGEWFDGQDQDWITQLDQGQVRHDHAHADLEGRCAELSVLPRRSFAGRFLLLVEL